MRSSLVIGKYNNCQSKLVEYGNLIQNEGYKISQVWQSEENYDEVGINFKEVSTESIFLISEGDILVLEMEHENADDVFGLVNLWNIIKAFEQGLLEA